MTTNEKIIAALAPTGLPVFPDIRQKYPEQYYTFNLTTIPDDFADDAPWHERVLVQVHLFLPQDFDSVQLRRDTKRYLEAGGFTWPGMTDATDEDGQHWVFECEDAEAVEHGAV